MKRRDPIPLGDQRVLLVHRLSACVVAAVIAVVGVVGFVGGLGFFDTRGAPVLGMSTNGALSTISLVTATVLVAAAVRGGRAASTVMIVIGVLFLVSAFVNLWLIGTPANLLAFRLPNVFFSIGAGLLLLFPGAYGRLSGGLPADNPYHLQRHPEDLERLTRGGLTHDQLPRDSWPAPGSAERAADLAMAAAARAATQRVATGEQLRRLAALESHRTHQDRRRVWMSFDQPEEATAPTSATSSTSAQHPAATGSPNGPGRGTDASREPAGEENHPAPRTPPSTER